MFKELFYIDRIYYLLIIARSSAIDVIIIIIIIIIIIFILDIPYIHLFLFFQISFFPSVQFLFFSFFLNLLYLCYVATEIYVLSTHFLGFQENSVQRSCGSYPWAIFQANHETLSRDQSGIGKCGHTRRSLKLNQLIPRITTQMGTIYMNQIMPVLLFNNQYFCFRVLMSVEWSYRYLRAVIGSF